MFDLERRIYRVDRLRLNPNGVPVRGVVYFLVLLVSAVAAARLPGIGAIARLVPWYLADVALPGLLAGVLTIVRIDGRPFHVAVQAIVAFRCSSRQLVCLQDARSRLEERWTPPPLLMIPDGSDSRIRRFRYAGPGVLRIDAAHALGASRKALAALRLRAHVTVGRRAGGAERCAEVIVLERGVRARVR